MNSCNFLVSDTTMAEHIKEVTDSENFLKSLQAEQGKS